MQHATPDRRATILVVEDEPTILQLAADALRDAGFEVIGVTAAEDALGLAVMDTPFDAVFTDINLAGVLDGFELAEALREMRPGIPVIYTSADTGNADASTRVQASLFIAKPYNTVAICELMKALAMARRTEVAANAPAPMAAGHPQRPELRLIA